MKHRFVLIFCQLFLAYKQTICWHLLLITYHGKTSCAWCDSIFCWKYLELNKGDKEKYIVYCMKKVFDPSLKGCDNKKCCTSLARKRSFTFFKLHDEKSILDMQICTLFLSFNHLARKLFFLGLNHFCFISCRAFRYFWRQIAHKSYLI